MDYVDFLLCFVVLRDEREGKFLVRGVLAKGTKGIVGMGFDSGLGDTVQVIFSVFVGEGEGDYLTIGVSQ